MGVFDSIKSGIRDVWDTSKSGIRTVYDNIPSPIRSVFSGIKKVLDNPVTKIAGIGLSHMFPAVALPLTAYELTNEVLS